MGYELLNQQKDQENDLLYPSSILQEKTDAFNLTQFPSMWQTWLRIHLEKDAEAGLTFLENKLTIVEFHFFENFFDIQAVP